jgi:hypothetical protein
MGLSKLFAKPFVYGSHATMMLPVTVALNKWHVSVFCLWALTPFAIWMTLLSYELTVEYLLRRPDITGSIGLSASYSVLVRRRMDTHSRLESKSSCEILRSQLGLQGLEVHPLD